MKIVDIKISRYCDKIHGIEIKEGYQWYFIQENEIDYVLNGYMFINKKYIKDIDSLEKYTMKYKVLNLKYTPPVFDISLNTYEDVLLSLKEQNELISIGLDNSGLILVGRIHKIHNKSFILNKIGINGEETGTENLKFSIIRYISIKSDYLNSLDLYLNINIY
jgi:hypothetical protein